VANFGLPQVVLFDLDDTLLTNDMAVFMPAYLKLLSDYGGREIAPELLLTALRSSVKAVMADASKSPNVDVFWRAFAPLIGRERVPLETFFSRFYQSQFAQLRSCTAPVVGAAELVDWFRRKNIPVVIATNPVFPRAAIEERLRWAGFEKLSDFVLITALENMSATKPAARYYAEIVERLGVPPTGALMIGNDWENDIEPAMTLGLMTFHVVAPGQFVPPGEPGVGRGSLDELRVYLTQ
jgi:FMN phosphatase YigB (HAD superfamily)